LVNTEFTNIVGIFGGSFKQTVVKIKSILLNSAWFFWYCREDKTAIISNSGKAFFTLTFNSSEVPTPLLHMINTRFFIGANSLYLTKYNVKNPISSLDIWFV